MADDPLQPRLDALQRALIPLTRHAALLPDPADLAFERTLDRSLARQLDHTSSNLLHLAERLLNWAKPVPLKLDTANDDKVELDPDLVKDGEYSRVVNTVEHWLEQADEHVEHYLGTGKHKRQVGAVGAKSQDLVAQRDAKRSRLDRLPQRLLHDSSIVKPQLAFLPRTKVPIPDLDDASANGEGGIPLWKPILRTKVHANRDEDDDDHEGEDGERSSWLQTELYEPTSRFTAVTRTEPPPYTRYVHPYLSELSSLSPPNLLSSTVPTGPVRRFESDSFDQTPFEWVGTRAALETMVDEIRTVGNRDGGNAKELAIDLEHHDLRSWSGITCLIQLSTREKDYVIDTLDPGVREHLEIMNEFLADPSWIKVLHGADSDIVWLQRDFGLYIVGLFDTYHATHVLGYPQHSLASLLDMFTDFVPDKRYQLADWRIRPLPKEMLHYARSDTHFLLNIYDHLRLALSSVPPASSSSSSTTSPAALSPRPSASTAVDARRTALEEVYHRSISTSLKTFSIAPFDDSTGHYDSGFLVPLSKLGQVKAYSDKRMVPTLPTVTGWGPGQVKFEVLRGLTRWREQVARREDESARYVLSLEGVCELSQVGPGLVRQSSRFDASVQDQGEEEGDREGERGNKDKEGEDAANEAERGQAEVVRILGRTRGGVSEVVRRRKREVYDLIRTTVERVALAKAEDANNGGSRSVGRDFLDEAAGRGSYRGEGAGPLSFDRSAAFEPSVVPVSGLWDSGATASRDDDLEPVQVASGSTLFGRAHDDRKNASTSSLLSSSSSSAAAGADDRDRRRPVRPSLVTASASSSFFGRVPLHSNSNASGPVGGNGKRKGTRSGGTVDRSESSDDEAEKRRKRVERVHASLVHGGRLAK
ncbi:hypothetical protein JCM10212_006472, partial [Sporobolomyces blumeae]